MVPHELQNATEAVLARRAVNIPVVHRGRAASAGAFLDAIKRARAAMEPRHDQVASEAGDPTGTEIVFRIAEGVASDAALRQSLRVFVDHANRLYGARGLRFAVHSADSV